MSEMKHSDIARNREDLVLENLVPAVKVFERRLREALKNRETGWHRLHIRLERGVVKTCQTDLQDQHYISDIADDHVDADPSKS